MELAYPVMWIQSNLHALIYTHFAHPICNCHAGVSILQVHCTSRVLTIVFNWIRLDLPRCFDNCFLIDGPVQNCLHTIWELFELHLDSCYDTQEVAKICSAPSLFPRSQTSQSIANRIILVPASRGATNLGQRHPQYPVKFYLKPKPLWHWAFFKNWTGPLFTGARPSFCYLAFPVVLKSRFVYTSVPWRVMDIHWSRY